MIKLKLGETKVYAAYPKYSKAEGFKGKGYYVIGRDGIVSGPWSEKMAKSEAKDYEDEVSVNYLDEKGTDTEKNKSKASYDKPEVSDFKRKIKRKIKSKKMFRGKEFGAYHKAEKLLKGMGYSIGSMQSDYPILAVKGKFHISKWDGLYDKAFEQKHMAVIHGDKRDGPVTVYFFENK